MGLKSLIAEKSHSNYRRILYFTAGTCPDEVYELAKDVSVTAVCILDEEGEIRTTERGMCVLTEIPLENLTTDTQNIIVQKGRQNINYGGCDTGNIIREK